VGSYVVTGGGGFIGSNIVARLVRDGHEVRVVDDFSTGRRENLTELAGRVALFEGTICDGDLLLQAFDGADCVLHQAALASVEQSVRDPLAVNYVNVEGTLNVLVRAREAGVRRVVYASSCAVYGDAPELPKREDMVPRPKSPYAVSKLTGELYCRLFHELFGLETVCLRYFNVFGPRQDLQGQYAAVIPSFMRQIMGGQSPQIFGDGEQTRDFVYVDNVVEANVLASTAEGAAGSVYNVGSGERRSLNELLGVMSELTGRPVRPEYLPERPGDLKHSVAAIEAARTHLGYEPVVSFEEGLRRTFKWYRRLETSTDIIS